MTSPRQLSLRTALFGGIALLLSACGGEISDLEGFHRHTLSDEVASTAQGEIHMVMSAVQSSIISTVMDTQNLETGSCKPKFSFAIIGVGFKFSDSENCKLRGSVMVKLFPLRATVDLELVGMKYLEHMNFDADIALSGGNGTVIDWTFINGRINLKNFALLPINELVLNGRTRATLQNGKFTLSSRTNAFDGSSGFGLALISEFNSNTKDISACLMTGGVGNNPNAGNMNSCVNLF